MANKRAIRFTTTDLATYLREPRSTIIRLAKRAGVLHWNKARTRAKPFTELEAMAVIAAKRMGRLDRLLASHKT